MAAAVSPPGTRRAHVVDRADPTKRPSTRRVLGIWSLGKRMPPEQRWPRLPWAAGREASSSSRWAPGTPPTPRRSTYSHAAPSPLGHSWNGHEKAMHSERRLQPSHPFIPVPHATGRTQLKKATVKDHRRVSNGKMPHTMERMPFPTG